VRLPKIRIIRLARGFGLRIGMYQIVIHKRLYD
jgi:hypothetical protein